jgi:serine/tyrosine/threonine adenylyltransferase
MFRFDNSYARLPDRFHVRLAPTPVREPTLVRLNEPLARDLGLDPAALASPAGVAMLAGNRIPAGSEPLAMAYAGHQFGGFVPQLGDGRAILLGEIIDRQGRRRDIQLKGSGPTPFSRRGDGRAALGPVLREYVVSEAFAALGIPTTRALAAVSTGEVVIRENYLPGAVLTRVASSHIRVGTFQYLAVRRDEEGVRQLADHVIERHYPEAASAGNRYRALYEGIVGRQANLVASWMLIGFIHGVMNTDNMAVSGETIDFGPCAFMDSFNPAQVFSSIDRQGRYAYENQPAIAQWNLARLAETMLPLFDENQEAGVAWAQSALDGFATRYQDALTAGMRRKLGLFDAADGDLAIGQQLFDLMATDGADFTLTFRDLAEAETDAVALARLRARFADPAGFDGWYTSWRARTAAESRQPAERRALMRASSPAFIPRNHLVEEVIAAAVNESDFARFERLVEVLARPYDDQPEHARYAEPPRPEQIVRQTFCGT